MSSELVGREAPLGVLRDALAASTKGRGRLILVTGEAGIGKTAISAAIAAEAEANGTAVIWGRAWEFADAPPYFPVWPCLRALGIPTDPDVLAQPFQVWERVVAQLAHQHPTLWILEDLHAADLGTLDLLTFLALPLRSLPILIVATVRTGEPRITDRMQQRFTRIVRDGVELPLTPLSDLDVAQVLEQALERPQPTAAVRRLSELTGGNPLFVVECARMFRAAGGIEGTIGGLPSTVRQVVLDRFLMLPEATRDALAAAAIVGREFTAGVLAKIHDALPARVIDELLPAVRTGLVTELRPGAFMFVHGLVRDAIEGSVTEQLRARLHDRACAALASLGDSADVLVERARHALAAIPAGDPGPSLELVRRATALLESEGATDRAFELQMRLDAARATGLFPPADLDEKLAVARLARGAQRSDVSRRLCEEVIAQARDAKDAVRFANAALLVAEDIRLGVVDTRQVELLREARGLLGEDRSRLACRVLARLAVALLPTPDMPEPRALASAAIDGARSLRDDRVILDVLDIAVWVIHDRPIREIVSWTSETLERAMACGDLEKALRALGWLAAGHIQAGDNLAWQQDVTSMLAISEELGHPRHRWRPLLHASGLALAHGRFTESERHVTEVSQLAELTDDPALEAALVVHDALRATLQRRDDDALAILARLDDVLRALRHSAEYVALIRAYAAARREDLDETREQLQRVRPGFARMLGEPGPLAMACEPIALAGSDEERRTARAALGEASGEHSGGSFSFTYEGPLIRLRALLDASLGDLASAERGLRSARELAIGRGHAPWIAQTSYELAKVLQRAGRVGEAADMFKDAYARAAELGMIGLAGSATATRELGARTLLIVREGDVWRIERGGTIARVKDSRGMQLLARLVEQRGRDVHVLTLASDESTSAPESDAGEVLDEAARRAYRERLRQLDVELANAESAGNAARASKLERERQALLGELARAAGLSGRTRRSGSATERARINVQRRLKDAIARIADADADLGEFLEGSIRTGTFCCYRP